ncbi:MAG: hypothetical protein HOP36_14070 [Methyloglobulus sp.]|nr:hypothetical protein [Methyloglobulus sp.]
MNTKMPTHGIIQDKILERVISFVIVVHFCFFGLLFGGGIRLHLRLTQELCIFHAAQPLLRSPPVDAADCCLYVRDMSCPDIAQVSRANTK